jgi:hypothetical protein
MNGAGERTLPAGERIVFDLTIDASGVRAHNLCRVVGTLINRLKRWRGLATQCDCEDVGVPLRMVVWRALVRRWIVTMAGVAARRHLRIRTPFPRARNRSQPTGLRAVAQSVRSSRVWVGTVVLGVLATLLSGVLLALPGQLLNPLSTKDDLRRGPDFSVGVDVVRLDDEGRSAVTQNEFRPSVAQVRMLARPNSATTAGFTGLLRSIGAVNLDTVTVRVTLTGHRNQQINIEDIRPLIVARSAPLSGSLLCVPSQGGAPTMNMLFDMDRPLPVAHDVKFGNDDGTDSGGNSREGIGPPFFGQRTITLQDNEQQVLLIRTVTRQHYVAFRLEATYMLGSQKKKAVIDDHGKPFQVSALVPTAAGATPVYRSIYAMRPDFSLGRTDPSALTKSGGPREGAC